MLAGAVQIIQTKSLSYSFPWYFMIFPVVLHHAHMHNSVMKFKETCFTICFTHYPNKRNKTATAVSKLPNVGRKSTLLRWKLSQCHVTAHAKMIDATGAFKDQSNNYKIPFIIHLLIKEQHPWIMKVPATFVHQIDSRANKNTTWIETCSSIFWSHHGDLLESGKCIWPAWSLQELVGLFRATIDSFWIEYPKEKMQKALQKNVRLCVCDSNWRNNPTWTIQEFKQIWCQHHT